MPGLLERPRYGDMQWGPFLLGLMLTGLGLAFVVSATADPAADYGWGREAKMQVLWWSVAITAAFVTAHVPLRTWFQIGPILFVGAISVQIGMFALAGTALVPSIKGAHNWIALGPARIQPSEFYKIASLLVCARLLANPQTDIRKLSTCLAIGFLSCLPAILIAKEDLGSALTFLPMCLGMLLLAGMPFRYLLGLMVAGTGTVITAISMLPRDSYHILRLKAWLDPESYSLTTGFQTLRALRSIGSGQVSGKGYGAGDQNLLGWLPEKHTDMIFAVIGEETGFLGCGLTLLLLLGFFYAGIYAAMRTRTPFGRFVICGFICLIMGQVTINLLVVLGLMPVTGITLPFFSYGGSSLLGTYIGLGICLSASCARRA